ncbi:MULTISPECIES: DNA-deoxyinosine glycosylase [unclassified Thioalkalivibrio]|uniref:DNA-deoxyinosine glycosylase n=1 Tax=unclassified Thioalkalivibrio TaxID=2621013 RepID=UPI0003796AB9|nr:MULTISPECIES: DNA-deoxyinosine glycosylase [unclassified Thioalkalivibrio]
MTVPLSSPELRAFEPVLRADTRAVVLGSFPGVASLEAAAYYAHPRNQFWPIMARILGPPFPELPWPERYARLLDCGVGLWDIYGACAREGSLDSAIRNPQPNDLGRLTREAPGLRLIVHNGAESARRIRETRALGVSAVRLPSTSPANARLGLKAKLERWAEAFREAGLGAPAP